MATTKNKVMIAVMILGIMLITSSIASAGITEFLRAKLTGRATTQTFDLNVSIGNSAPNVTFVSTIESQSITEGTITNVEFNFLLTDVDGAGNIDTTSGRANFTYQNESTVIVRSNNSCASLGAVGATQVNFSCTIGIWYFDPAAVDGWKVTAYGEDVSGASGQNDTTNFTLLSTAGFVSAPGLLTFSTLSPGDTNTTATNNPLTLNNTGNKHIEASNISVNSTDLVGEENSAYALYAENFTIGITSGGSPPLECGGANSTFLDLSQYQSINNATLPYGNVSAGGGAGQEQLYICLTQAGSELITQAYSTAGQGAWTIRIQ